MPARGRLIDDWRSLMPVSMTTVLGDGHIVNVQYGASRPNQMRDEGSISGGKSV